MQVYTATVVNSQQGSESRGGEPAPDSGGAEIISDSLMPGSREAMACWNWALSPDCAAS